MTTFHTKGQLHPNNTPEESYKKVEKAAANYAGLPYPFDMEEEKYYQLQKIDMYNAYIAGYVAALTSPVIEEKINNSFNEMEAYLDKQL